MSFESSSLGSVVFGGVINSSSEVSVVLTGTSSSLIVNTTSIGFGIGLIGATQTGVVGTVQSSAAVSVGLTTVASTATVSTLTAYQDLSVTLSSTLATTNLQSITTTQAVNISLVNNAATGALGNLSPPEFSFLTAGVNSVGINLAIATTGVQTQLYYSYYV